MRFRCWGIVATDLQKTIRVCRRFLRLGLNAETMFADSTAGHRGGEDTDSAPVWPSTCADPKFELQEFKHARVTLTLIENKGYRDPGSHEPMNDANAALHKSGSSGCMTATDYIWSVGTFV